LGCDFILELTNKIGITHITLVRISCIVSLITHVLPPILFLAQVRYQGHTHTLANLKNLEYQENHNCLAGV